MQKHPSRKASPSSPFCRACLHLQMLNPALADVMYAAFMKSVNDAQASIKDFTELMKDDTSKAVFDRADKSKEANPLGIVPWKHKDYPDWFVMDKD